MVNSQELLVGAGRVGPVGSAEFHDSLLPLPWLGREASPCAFFLAGSGTSSSVTRPSSVPSLQFGVQYVSIHHAAASPLR
jgi:hypothetical protein